MKTLVIIVTSVVMTLGTAGGVSWWWSSRSAEAAAQPVAVWTVTLEPATLVQTVSAPGALEPRRQVSISARVSARIAELPFEAGQTVTRGDPAADPPVPASVLVRLDANDLEAALQSAKARRAAQEAQVKVNEAQIRAREERLHGTQALLTEAEQNLDRQLRLLASHHVSQSVVDQAQSRTDELRYSLAAEQRNIEADRLQLEVLRHNLAVADAEIDQAEGNLAHTIITSPIDGTVTRVHAKEGELVVTGTMNNPGTVILEVADLEHMLVKAEVTETDITQVQPGQPVRVSILGHRDATYAGSVESVALVSSTGSDGGRYYEVKILLETDGQRIHSGLSANVEIQTHAHEGIIKVPSQAVLGVRVDELPRELRSENPHVDMTRTLTPVVYRLLAGRAVATPVSLGPSDATHTLITGGLSAGDVVIVGPYRQLEQLRHDQPARDEAEPQRVADDAA